MDSRKISLPGSTRQPIGKRTGEQPGDETIEVSVILKPMSRAPHTGGAIISREEFAAKHGADPKAIQSVREFAKQNSLKVSEVSPERRTVKLEGTAANMSRAFEAPLARYEEAGQQYRARTGDIKLPADLAESVEAVVLGLDNRPQAKPHFRIRAREQKPH